MGYRRVFFPATSSTKQSRVQITQCPQGGKCKPSHCYTWRHAPHNILFRIPIFSAIIQAPAAGEMWLKVCSQRRTATWNTCVQNSPTSKRPSFVAANQVVTLTRVTHGVVVSGVRHMNEVNPRRDRLVLGWVTVFGRVYHLGM